MPTPKFFNKGLLKGTITKSELIEFERKDNTKDKFLALEVDTGDNNKVKATMFPTQNSPNKAKETYENYPVGSKVEVSGNVREQEFETQSGNIGIDRSVQAISVRNLKDGTREMATFILQGIVEKVVEVEDGVEVSIRVDNTYTPKGSDTPKTISDYFTLYADEEKKELLEELDVVVGCNAKFKGYILNKLVFDDFGDIIDNERMFKIERIENVVDPDELEEQEEAPFL